MTEEIKFASELNPRRGAVCKFAEDPLEEPPALGEDVDALFLEPTAD